MIYWQQWHDILYDGFTRIGSAQSLWCRQCEGGTNAQNIFKQLTVGNLVNNVADITAKAKAATGCHYCNQGNDLKSWGDEVGKKVSEIQKFSAFF